MAIKQEEALELIKFLNLEEAADLEAAKEKFRTAGKELILPVIGETIEL